MNPLPNRPLLNNSSLPVALPNVPSFDSVAFNGRPRKVMPDVGKDFSILNGMSALIPGPPSGPPSAAGQSNPIDRAGILGSALLQSQQQQAVTGPPLGQQVQLQPAVEAQPPPPVSQPAESKELEIMDQSGVPTAIFRPDDAGEWREKLRLSHEAAERARADQPGGSILSGAASWERRSRDDDEESKPDEETEVEDEESGDIGEGEGSKIWKAKRTLRKSV